MGYVGIKGYLFMRKVFLGKFWIGSGGNTITCMKLSVYKPWMGALGMMN